MTVFPSDDGGYPGRPVTAGECGRCADYYLRGGWPTDAKRLALVTAIAAAESKEKD